jgi:hypothetical protein
MEELPLASVPLDEDAVQVGSDQAHLIKLETQIFFRQLHRHFEKELQDSNCFLRVKTNYHEFGTYYDVVVKYRDTNEADEDCALHMESNLPCKWDEEAIKELKEKGIRDLTDRN